MCCLLLRYILYGWITTCVADHGNEQEVRKKERKKMKEEEEEEESDCYKVQSRCYSPSHMLKCARAIVGLRMRPSYVCQRNVIYSSHPFDVSRVNLTAAGPLVCRVLPFFRCSYARVIGDISFIKFDRRRLGTPAIGFDVWKATSLGTTVSKGMATSS